jgi:(E)-4-hydroxy-3-methylbut-2-enyl-diphosphate synthase
MTNTPTADCVATLAQIRELAANGCDVIRVAVPDQPSVESLRHLVRESPVPVIADIHFDYRLALASLAAGAHGIRINPGNLGGADRIRAVATAARDARVAVRIGVNAGSLNEQQLAAGGGDRGTAMVAAALAFCQAFEAAGCTALKVSLKASDVPTTVAAYRLFAAQADYPLHVGVTEAGTPAAGIVKSAVGIGSLLLDGIGDTIRVSLTAPPVEEVKAGIRILEAVGLREAAPEIVSCPTCGRTRIALQPLVEAVEDEIRRLKAAGHTIKLRKIALMGCVVNGPGEARDADLGIAGGDGKGALFRHGQVVRTVPEGELLAAFLEELHRHTVPPVA